MKKYATDFWACSVDAAKWFYREALLEKSIVIHNAIDVKKVSFDDAKRQEIRDYQALMAHLRTLDSHDSRRACCVRRMESLSRCLTATVSYVGKSDLGDTERYIREFHALPSTALPSTHVPLTIEMGAVNGCFFINFLQFFRERDYFDAFTRQLDQNGIDYEVLSSGEALYPRMELPF